MVDLVIFDFDGTLIDSKVDIVNSVSLMLAELGLPKRDEQEIESFIGKGVRQLIIDSVGERHISRLDEGIKIYKDIYRRHMFDTTVLYPGVKEVLERIRHKKTVIMSNKSEEFIKLLTDKFGITKYFIRISGGDNENCRKPSPCPVLKLLKEFRFEPKKAIMAGDSGLDIISGRDVGIITCGVTYGIGKKEEILAAKPDFVIDDIKKLIDIVK